MSMIERDRFALRSPAFLWAGKAYAAVARAIREKLRQKRHHKALVQLSEMEDWQLEDIGLTRSAVEDALFARK